MRRLRWTWALCWLTATLFAANAAETAEPKLLARPDAFRTLVNPNCSHCIDEAKARAADLRDDDRVLAWIRGKYDGGAIPLRFFLVPFRVISDTYGVFVFDPEAGFARGYEPSLDFTFHGWRNGIVVMKHKDGTLFSGLSGLAFDGPRKGQVLEPIPTLMTRWGPWKQAYPGSVAYRMFEKYQPVELPAADYAASLATRGPADPRLPADAEVLGVRVGNLARAYPLSQFAPQGEAIRDRLGQQDLYILWNGKTHTAAAYSTMVDVREQPQTVVLRYEGANPLAPFLDERSGSRLGVEGRGVEGSLRGKTLRWIDSVQCRWFAWAAEYPQSQVFNAGNTKSSSAPSARGRMKRYVLVEPGQVAPDQVETWRHDGLQGVVVVLDDPHDARVYHELVDRLKPSGLELYYWIEIGRNPQLADAHPRWMASLGMHHDWQRRFAEVAPPGESEVAKAWPWVPIAYREAFDAHLERVKRLLAKVPETYRGLLLNDLQAGPASCGCGNWQCRWAIDYGVPSTTEKLEGDDIAARFVVAVEHLAAGKPVIPVWMTECQDQDLPPDRATGGKSTGLCGSVPCAASTCPRAFARQLGSLIEVHRGPLALMAVAEACGRSTRGDPTEWASVVVNDAEKTLARQQVPPLTRDRLWLVVARRDTAMEQAIAELRPACVVFAETKIEQAYEPRVISAPQASDSIRGIPVQN